MLSFKTRRTRRAHASIVSAFKFTRGRGVKCEGEHGGRDGERDKHVYHDTSRTQSQSSATLTYIEGCVPTARARVCF